MEDNNILMFNSSNVFYPDESGALLGVFITLVLMCTIMTVIAFGKKFYGVSLNWVLLGNYRFWVLLLYVVACLLTVIRQIVISYYPDFSPHFTILYNWAATLIVHINSLFPWQLYRHGTQQTKNKNKVKEAQKHFLKVLFAIFFWTALLAVSLVLIHFVDVPIEVVTLGWRINFMTGICIEIALLFFCLRHFSGTSKEREYRLYVKCTLWMRGGIAVSNIFRYTAIPAQQVGVIHMFFVCTALAVNNRKAIHAVGASTVAASVFTHAHSGHSALSLASGASTRSLVTGASTRSLVNDGSTRSVAPGGGGNRDVAKGVSTRAVAPGVASRFVAPGKVTL